MVGNLLFFIFSLSIFTSYSQSEVDAVKRVAQLYIDGTSFSYPDKIEEAFHPDISMYFTKQGQPWSPTRAEYIRFFESEEPGTYTGRVGRILTVDQLQDIAMVKLEIIVPKRNWLYTDFLLLKKMDETWYIMSKTAISHESNKMGKKILFVVSNQSTYGDTEINTSNHFAELALPYDELTSAGYKVDFVSPNGGSVPIGYIETRSPIIKKYIYDLDLMYALKNTAKPSEIDPKEYSAIIYGGGGAAMFGIDDNVELQNIALSIYEENQGIVSAICHGTAGIVNIKTSEGKYLLTGKNVTGFPDHFENKDAEYYNTFPFSIEDRARLNGGVFKYYKEGWDGYYEVDGRIITGQDPSAARIVAKKIIESLNEQ